MSLMSFGLPRLRDLAVLKVFDSLPLKERLFVRGRLLTAPLGEMADRVAGTRVVDVGCGHGVLSALSHAANAEREVVGIDLDPRKIEWATDSVGRLPRTHFECIDVSALAQREPASFDTVMLVDVLYLLPLEQWPQFLGECRKLLKKNGILLFKEVEADAGWKSKKALLQELVMVKLLGRTHSSGALSIHSRDDIVRAVEAAGLEVREVIPFGGYTTPHVLFVAAVK